MATVAKPITAAWRGLETHSSERLELTQNSFQNRAVSVYTEGDTTIRYEIECDPLWRVRKAIIQTPEEAFILTSDGNGAWKKEGHDMPELNGAIDIDLTITPFTNTIPIRRLKLKDGQAAEIKVAYIKFPELQITTDRQRYTRLSEKLYRFEALDTGFIQEIQVDADGLVIIYPELFVRAATRRQ